MSIELGEIIFMFAKNKSLILITAILMLILSVAGCTSQSTQTEVKPITDMAGRTVEIPAVVEKVYCADPMSAITMYTLAPEKLLGWCYQLNDAELSYINENYRDLPVFGMNDNINYEAVISANPDVAFLTGKISDTLIEKADKMQETLGVPVIVIENLLESTPDAYTLFGEVTGDTEQAEKLSNYSRNTLGGITEIPEGERTTIYYANGIDSLNTSSKGSAASQIFDMVYAENVCQLSSESGDRIQVTAEHVIEWNPEFIFVNGEPKENYTGSIAAQEVLNNPVYENVDAVISGNVINIPKSPFAWLDRPRSLNRIIGINWLGSIIYPDYYTFTNDDIREFYSLFYHVDLTDEKLEELLLQ